MFDRDEEASQWAERYSTRSRARGLPIHGVAGLVVAGMFLGWVGLDRSADGEGKPLEACQALLRVRECPISALAWSPDGRWLALSGFGATVRLWDRETGRLASIEAGTVQPRFVIGWSECGDDLVLGGIEVPVEAWEMVASAIKVERKVKRPEGLQAVAKMIAEASRGGPIRVRGPIDGRSAWLPASDSTAISAAFSPDGRSIVTAEVDQSVRVWDARNGRLRFRFRSDPRGMSCVAFSPDGSKVAAGGGGSLRVWDAFTGSPLATLGGMLGGSAVIGFSPDGTLLAGASWDGTIRVWDIATGLERAKLGGHDGQVLSLAWSPDGRLLATGGYDSTVRLWDVSNRLDVARAD